MTNGKKKKIDCLRTSFVVFYGNTSLPVRYGWNIYMNTAHCVGAQHCEISAREGIADADIRCRGNRRRSEYLYVPPRRRIPGDRVLWYPTA